MKNNSKLFRLYLPLFIISASFATVMRTIACFLDFNAKTGHFGDKTLISIADYTVICAVAFFLIYAMVSKKHNELIPSFSTPATYIPGGAVCISILFLSIFLCKKAIEKKELIDYYLQYGNAQELAQIQSERLQIVILLATVVLSFFSIAHFVLTAILEKPANTKRGSHALSTVLFLSLYAIYIYFSTDLPLNAHSKIIDQLAVLLTAVFFLYEARLSLGREKWKGYITFGFVAALLSAYSSIPTLITYFAKSDFSSGRIFCISNNVYESALVFSLFIFITARLVITASLIEKKESPAVSAIIAFADKRAADIAPVIEEAVETDTDVENQITIDELDSQEATIEESEATEETETTQIEGTEEISPNPEETID